MDDASSSRAVSTPNSAMHILVAETTSNPVPESDNWKDDKDAFAYLFEALGGRLLYIQEQDLTEQDRHQYLKDAMTESVASVHEILPNFSATCDVVDPQSARYRDAVAACIAAQPGIANFFPGILSASPRHCNVASSTRDQVSFAKDIARACVTGNQVVDTESLVASFNTFVPDDNMAQTDNRFPDPVILSALFDQERDSDEADFFRGRVGLPMSGDAETMENHDEKRGPFDVLSFNDKGQFHLDSKARSTNPVTMTLLRYVKDSVESDVTDGETSPEFVAGCIVARMLEYGRGVWFSVKAGGGRESITWENLPVDMPVLRYVASSKNNEGKLDKGKGVMRG